MSTGAVDFDFKYVLKVRDFLSKCGVKSYNIDEASYKKLIPFIQDMMGCSYDNVYVDKVIFISNDAILDFACEQCEESDSYEGNSFKIYGRISDKLFNAVPKLKDGYSWSKPRAVSDKIVGALKGFGDMMAFSEHIHLYDNKGTPVVEYNNGGIDGKYHRVGKDYNKSISVLVNSVVSEFGTNIKEVYFINGCLHFEAVARKNSDGELTLTIY